MRIAPARTVFGLLVLMALTFSGAAEARPETISAPAAFDGLPASDIGGPQAPTDHHTQLIDGFVSNFTVADPIVYWLTQPASCLPSPDSTRILRTRTTGWDPRYLFNRLPGGGDPCPYQVYSNIVADSQYLYWNDSTGLVRLPVDANTADVPETVLPVFAGVDTELVLMGDYVIGISEGSLWGMSKANPANNFNISTFGPDTARMLKTDGTYIYMIRSPGNKLDRFTRQGDHRLIDTDVTDYAPAGPETVCPAINCVNSEYVYYVKTTTPLSIQRYNGANGNYDTPYTATLPPGYTARIYGLAVGDPVVFNSHRVLFFWEKRWVPCACFETNSTDYLNRLFDGVIHTRTSTTSWNAEQAQTGGEFLFWKDMPSLNANLWGSVYRIPQDADVLPVVNLRVWDWELNQSIQDKDQSIFLVRNKRSFFRLFVSSDGADVEGVTARLTAYWDNAPQGTIAPITPLITVRKARTKDIIGQQFIFELPLDWTTHNDLVLEPVLNPFGFPLEPSYNDNRFSQPLGPFEFRANPAARFRLMRVSYTWNNKSYTSRDQDAIVSWLYRAYPIGIDPGAALPGFDTYSDTTLGPRVQDFNNAKECQNLDQTKNGGSDNRNLCASYFLHAQLEMFRRTNAVPTNAYIYASVLDLGRGSASGTAPVSNGPDLLSKGTSFALAGYYGGHELGHLLGRGHPAAMSDDPATKNVTEACGHSRDDMSFPYVFGWIGESPNSNYGLDSQLNVPNGSLRLMRYYDVRDVMTYCNTPDQWVSDYTYTGIYDWLNLNPGPARPAETRLPKMLSRPQNGDTVLVDGWIYLAGLIAVDGKDGLFTHIERSDSMALTPVQQPGSYEIRLLDETGGVLSQIGFTPVASEESPDWLTFTESVPYATGTRTIQVVNTGSGDVILTQEVSLNPPVIDSAAPARSVALPGEIPQPSDPLPDSFTLNWNADDPDGETLTFDVLFSLDSLLFNPVVTNLTGNSVVIDTTTLPGGTGRFRVIASDGVNTSYIDSDPVTLAVKAPQVHILTPSDGQTVQYSAPLNFSGYADDLQDGSLTGDMLSWSTQYGAFATGPNATALIMPTGWVTVTLSAQNSAGVTGETSVVIFVGDDLNKPPAAAEVSPQAVNFQAENDSVASLQASLAIANIGGPGTINWAADLGGASWLTADVVEGTVPYSLTLTADPSGLDPNSTIQTTLVIQAAVSGGGTQTFEIPITLQIGLGDVWAPPLEALRNIFLPVIRR